MRTSPTGITVLSQGYDHLSDSSRDTQLTFSQAAHVIYDDHKDVTAAMGAKHEFTQQIFTKTMTLQVWKPEFERPGRHFVYTTRYVYFFVHLLDQLNDRASLDQLLRRVRKRQGDFINHSKLWEDICIVYIKVGYHCISKCRQVETNVFS